MMASPTQSVTVDARLFSAPLHVPVDAQVSRGVVVMQDSMRIQLTVTPRRHDGSGGLIVSLSDAPGTVIGMTESVELYVEDVKVLDELVEADIGAHHGIGVEALVRPVSQRP